MFPSSLTLQSLRSKRNKITAGKTDRELSVHSEPLNDLKDYQQLRQTCLVSKECLQMFPF